MKVPLSYAVALLLVKDNEFSPFLIEIELSTACLPSCTDEQLNNASSTLSHSLRQLPWQVGSASTRRPLSRGGQTSLPQAPGILQPWIYLYNAVPNITVPFTNLDVSFTIFSALLFTCMDFVIAAILYEFGWPRRHALNGKQTRAVAGSLTTIIHSTSLVTYLGVCLYSHQDTPSSKLSDAPQCWQNAAHALIQFCTGYVLYDALVQFVVDNWVKGVGPVLSGADWMFIGHHAATSLYMTSARILEAGHVSAMILMTGGEFTAPFQNAFRISRIANKMEIGGSLGQMLHPCIRYVWAVLYLGGTSLCNSFDTGSCLYQEGTSSCSTWYELSMADNVLGSAFWKYTMDQRSNRYCATRYFVTRLSAGGVVALESHHCGIGFSIGIMSFYTTTLLKGERARS